jgi:anti-sigma factor RsiW
MNSRPITEDDLHAFVDGVLDSARHAEVAAYLGRHPEIAARVQGYATQREILRMTLAPIAEEPIPPHLDIGRMIEARRRRPWTSAWFAAAAAALLLTVGGAGGWALRGAALPASEGVLALAREAADSYRVYVPDRVRPVEIRAPEAGELVDWASQRLHRPLAVPDLSAAGYRFMGGRVLSTAHGPGVMLMYDDDHGTRIVVMTRPMSVDQNRPMVLQAQGALNGFSWADHGMGYSVVGPRTPEIIHSLADDVRRQVRQGI